MLIPQSHIEYAIGICERIDACSCGTDDIMHEFCYYFNFRLPTIICNDAYNIRLYGLAAVCRGMLANMHHGQGFETSPISKSIVLGTCQ